MKHPQHAAAIVQDLLMAAGAAFLAGATDVYGLAKLGHLFVSFMSGNTTKLAVAIGQGHWSGADRIAAIIGLFVLGAFVGEIIGVLGGRRHVAVVTFAVAVLLAVPVVAPGWEVTALVLAMGALNASMAHVGETTISLTYVTGTLVKLGRGVGRLLCGRHEDLSWTLQLPLWVSLLGGAVAATLVRGALGPHVLWPLPALALLLALAALAQSHEVKLD